MPEALAADKEALKHALAVFVDGLSGPASTQVQWSCDDQGVVTASHKSVHCYGLVVQRRSRYDVANGATLVDDYNGGHIAIEAWAA